MVKTGFLYNISGVMTGALAVINTLSSINNFVEFNKYNKLGGYLIKYLADYNPFVVKSLSYSIRIVPEGIIEKLYSLADVTIHLNDLFNESLFKNGVINAASAIALGLASALLIKEGMKIDDDNYSLENRISTYEIKNLYTFKE